ncbi:MAG: rhodanese-like domain-containing protein [Schlesneria sp.]
MSIAEQGRPTPGTSHTTDLKKQDMAHHSPRFLQLVNAVRVNIRECSVVDVHKRITAEEKFLLFDVREESEYAAGHLPGAKSLGKGIIERDIEVVVPDFDQEIVLYCGGGFRSALAADNLQKMGYTHVISMDGGFRSWKESGYRIET